ncbi:cytochrome b/b6 domain-containing protein [Actinospica durhamensis]|uniref:Cytochrome b/b6 domain-containing protein n=1 Tax=Actinospica durhamensis TaxID=1508375 RepID=A0A941ET63_9ACTN|nr:cytochrome b/b6 domain-containing protein [Actinospica durhamensis]MBR7836836.1 cytochrome b/b6 domain-containing protein [Actinospica durhamensis]
MPPPRDEAGRIERFTRAERYVHWATTVLMFVLIATGAILYNDQLAIYTGHRQFVAVVHLYCGFALPVPMAAGVFSKAYRADARRLNRHTAQDLAWLRHRGWKRGRVRERGLKVGKFNAGQKLNAAFLCGAILVMAGTGTIMWFQGLASVSMRTGATFVHDWLALAVGFDIIGHVYFAVGDRHARAGMRRGTVPRSWAEHEHELWAQEIADQEARAGQD